MGTASIQAHTTWFFHADPNSINWTYNLKTNVTETYGGKVVQILSVNWDQLSVNFEAGSGGEGFSSGREYMHEFSNFFKDAIVWQRDTGQPSIFTYPPRAYVFSCYLDSLGIADNLQNVLYPMSIKAKIQRDLMGTVRTEALSSALARLNSGVGWSKNEYTYNQSQAQQQAEVQYGENADGGTLGGI